MNNGTTSTPVSPCDPTIKNCGETGTPSLPGPPLSNNPPSHSQEHSSNPTPPTDNGNGNNNENNGGTPSQREKITTVKAVMIVAQTVEKPIQVQVHSLIHRTRAPEKDIKLLKWSPTFPFCCIGHAHLKKT